MDSTVLVTGSTDGIGRQTAVELARLGYRVLLHGRDPARVEAAKERLAAAAPEAPAPEGFVADLADLTEVDRLADEVAGRHPVLSALVNNAGVFVQERQLSKQGFELTFAVNHLAHFRLTRRLTSALDAGAPSRVVTVASVAHTRGDLDFDDLQLQQDFDGYDAYARSKLCNVMFASALARRLDAARTTSNSLHPGVIGTKLLAAGFGIDGASVEDGARTSVHLASSKTVAGVTGGYFVDCKEAPASETARSLELQEKLWEVSESLLADAGFR